MALVLPCGGASEPQLLDPHGGQLDLAARQLRFLHPHSLRDDPTRLLRAARYAARLGFNLAPDALQQAASTLEAWPWAWRLGDDPALTPPALGTRLRMELELLLEREPWRQALAMLQRWGGLVLLDPQLQRDSGWRCRLPWARRFGLPLLPALVACAAQPLPLARRLQLPHGQQRWLQQLRQLSQVLLAQSWPQEPAGWCDLLEVPGCSPEAVGLGVITGAQPRSSLLRWFVRWRHVKAPVTAAQLLREGWQAGPQLGAELKRRRRLVLAKHR